MFRRRQRFLAALGAVSFVAAAGAPTPLADAGLRGAGPIVQAPASSSVSPTGTPSLGDLTGAVAPATKTATEPVRSATFSVAPVVPATRKAVAEPVRAATRTVARVVRTAQNATDEPLRAASQAGAPVIEAAATRTQPVIAAATQIAEPVVAEAGRTLAPVLEPVVNLVQQVLQPGPRPLDDVLGAVTSPVKRSRPGSGGGLAPTSATTNGTTGGSSSSPQAATPATRVSRPTSKRFANPPDAQLPGFHTLPSAPVGDPPVTATGNVAATSQPTAPLPGLPGGPLTALFTASASVGAGALVILLAALAAALHLAVPGLGRRLRPGLAPWSQPLPHLSLERPG